MNLYHDIYGYLRTLVFEDLRVYPSCVAYFYYGKLEERALSRAWTRPCQSITPLSEHGVPSGNLIIFNIAIESGPVEIVDLSTKSGDFPYMHWIIH